jgi:hypothetical protein
VLAISDTCVIRFCVAEGPNDIWIAKYEQFISLSGNIAIYAQVFPIEMFDSVFNDETIILTRCCDRFLIQA